MSRKPVKPVFLGMAMVGAMVVGCAGLDDTPVGPDLGTSFHASGLEPASGGPELAAATNRGGVGACAETDCAGPQENPGRSVLASAVRPLKAKKAWKTEAIPGAVYVIFDGSIGSEDVLVGKKHWKKPGKYSLALTLHELPVGAAVFLGEQEILIKDATFVLEDPDTKQAIYRVAWATAPLGPVSLVYACAQVIEVATGEPDSEELCMTLTPTLP